MHGTYISYCRRKERRGALSPELLNRSSFAPSLLHSFTPSLAPSLLHSCTPSLPHSLTPFAHFACPGICPRLPAPSPTPLARSSASRTEVLGVAGPSKRDKALFRSRRRKRWVLCMLIDCARTKYHTKHPLFPSIFPVTGHALRGNPCSSWCLAV
jgi:hypothetical protein